MTNAYIQFTQQVRASREWQSHGAKLPVPEQGKLLGQMYRGSGKRVTFDGSDAGDKPTQERRRWLMSTLLKFGLGAPVVAVVGPKLLDAIAKHPKSTAVVVGILVAAGMSKKNVEGFIKEAKEYGMFTTMTRRSRGQRGMVA